MNEFDKAIEDLQAVVNAYALGKTDELAFVLPANAVLAAYAAKPEPAVPEGRLADALRWIVRHAEAPEKAARGPHRGMAAIKHVAERALEQAPPAAAVPLWSRGSVWAMWQCARRNNATIPDAELDAMRDALLAAAQGVK